jgi:hypothetical protein
MRANSVILMVPGRCSTMSVNPQLTQDADERSEVAGNARLTALASAVLLVLLTFEILTVPSLRTLIAVHIFIGVFLAIPLVVKIGSVGYRFARYYTGSPAFVRSGPPSLGLRVLAPLLLAATLLLIGSGIALLAVAPARAGTLRIVHIFSYLIWMPMVAIHIFAHFRHFQRLIAEERGVAPAEPAPGRNLRLWVILGALALGAMVATLALVVSAPWIDWLKTGETGPGPFVVGVVAAVLALLTTELLKRK